METQKNTETLSPEERATMIGLLKRVDRAQPLGTELYDAIALLSLSVAIEAITLRQGKNGIEVFLTKRSETDTAYAGMYHSPGTVRRPEETLEAGFKRLEIREFKGNLTSSEFIGNHDCPDEARGHFLQVMYLCSMDGDCSDNWYPVDNLPEPIVPNHKEVLIPAAVKAFKKKLVQ